MEHHLLICLKEEKFLAAALCSFLSVLLLACMSLSRCSAFVNSSSFSPQSISELLGARAYRQGSDSLNRLKIRLCSGAVSAYKSMVLKETVILGGLMASSSWSSVGLLSTMLKMQAFSLLARRSRVSRSLDLATAALRLRCYSSSPFMKLQVFCRIYWVLRLSSLAPGPLIISFSSSRSSRMVNLGLALVGADGDSFDILKIGSYYQILWNCSLQHFP